MPGQCVGGVDAALDRGGEQTAVPDGQPGDGQRGDGRDETARDREPEGREGRGRQVAGRERRRRTSQQPAGQADEGYAEGQHRQPGEAGEHDRRRRTEPGAGGRAADAGADPGAAPAAAGEQLHRQQEQAERDQHERQQGGGGPVEAGPVLVEDPGRERRVVEDLQRAVLPQQVQADQQRAAQHGRADRRQHDPEERGRRPVPEGRGDVLQRGVQPAQGGDGRQVDERVVGQAHDQHGAGVRLHGMSRGDPAVAVDEGGYGEGCGEHAVPQVPAKEVGADHEPRAGHAQHHAERDAADEEAGGVPEQATHARPDQEVDRLPRPELGGGDDDVPQREQAGRGDQCPQQGQNDARPPSAGAGADGQRNPASVIRSTTLAPSRSLMATAGGSSSESGLTGGARLTAGLSGYSSA